MKSALLNIHRHKINYSETLGYNEQIFQSQMISLLHKSTQL